MNPARDVEKGLKRHNAELAIGALLKLAPEQRSTWFSAVCPLLQEEVVAAQRRKDWACLHAWAVRVDKEPGLLGALSASERAGIRWALLWGCIFNKDVSRACVHFEGLAPALSAVHPAEADALRAWLHSG